MLEADRIADRRRLKRSLTLWRVLAIIAAVVAGAVALLPLAGPDGRDYVARIRVDDVITGDTWREGTLRRLADDPRCRALVVRIDSPGGTFVGSEILMRGLRRVAETRPVVAVMDNVAASGGYMTALGADRVFASAATITASIGVILQTADVTGLLERIGIRPETVKSGPLKAQPNPLEAFSDDARASLQAMIMDSHAAFVDMVAERRGLALEDARALADGRVMNGRQARAARLVDEIGDEAAAMAWLRREKGIDPGLPVHDLEPPAETRWLRDLVQGRIGKVLFSERVRLDGVLALWQPGL